MVRLSILEITTTMSIKKAEMEISLTEEALTSNQAKEASPVNDYQAQKESQKELRKLMRQIEKS